MREVVEHTFRVGNLTIRKLCQERTVVAVNGHFPGPSITAHEGDSVVVHVINGSPYNITLHWHGIFQLLTAWADGPGYVTQCPIPPGEGTLWWHAHSSYLRATVYGSFTIYPRAGPGAYPFPKPYREVPLLLGEWWNANVVDVEEESLSTGGAPNISDAFTINGRPGDLYPCSRDQTFKLRVVHGKTYLLRIVNAALNQELFFMVAGHSLTVVAIDASYTVPYPTDVVVIAPGQTVDALLDATAAPGRYYMAAHTYASVAGVPFPNTTTTGILYYGSSPPSSSPPIMPALPAFNDTPTAHKFYTNLSALLRPCDPQVPLAVDEEMFITFGLGLVPCDRKNSTCAGPFGEKFAASMSNNSFQFPTELSLLQAHFFKVPGVFTLDFPDRPPVVFNYTSPNVTLDLGLLQTVKQTRGKRLKYNSTVEVVLQNTALLGTENHPIHLHGFNFFVLAQGFGNYNPTVAKRSFNLVHPQVRNTIAVPAGGWAVIRFVANNPGVWFMHCHIDAHMPWGLGMVFVVEDGPTPSSKLPRRPPTSPAAKMGF
ncbi:unnamed protein product [Spirodela intermedia]|uniref:Laccase n=1 Tax=Spirodela intermedia TaxID=51605 RepID=A0A7I8JI66_SPIIN|nr:unnamed protein product [Spirodela intermedia]CAA6669435.1 unnamed protein product [Spirodela intermedia]